jgi:ribonuclease P/MRP protein subunit POP5
MRENYRYLLARINPDNPSYDAKEIYLAVSEAFSSLFGEIKSAHTWIAVMEASNRFVIFRYRRGMDTQVESAIASVCCISGVPVALHPLKKSGTIRTLREEQKKLINLCAPSHEGSIKRGDAWYPAVISQSGQIDLKEKGINLQIPLYITEEDIEDLYYDE